MSSPGNEDRHPAVTVADISDPTVADAGFELLKQDTLQLQSIPMQVRRVVVRLESAAVVFYHTNLRVRTRTTARRGLLAYVTFGPQASGTANGVPVRPGLIHAVEPGAENSFVTSAGWESVSFLLPPEDMKAHLTARGRAEEFHVPRGIEPLEVDAQRVRGLFDWGKRLVETALRQPEIFEPPAKERVAAQDEMLEMLLATLRIADGFESTRSDRTHLAQSQIVQVAEQYALAHTGDRLYVTDLCRAAAVSERTLEYAFKEVTGLTPMNYLVRFRLHRVRQALMTAAPESTTVSVEALNWGFWHFGEFSRAYRECFGELPSDTLRRRP